MDFGASAVGTESWVFKRMAYTHSMVPSMTGEGGIPPLDPCPRRGLAYCEAATATSLEKKVSFPPPSPQTHAHNRHARTRTRTRPPPPAPACLMYHPHSSTRSPATAVNECRMALPPPQCVGSASSTLRGGLLFRIVASAAPYQFPTTVVAPPQWLQGPQRHAPPHICHVLCRVTLLACPVMSDSACCRITSCCGGC